MDEETVRAIARQMSDLGRQLIASGALDAARIGGEQAKLLQRDVAQTLAPLLKQDAELQAILAKWAETEAAAMAAAMKMPTIDFSALHTEPLSALSAPSPRSQTTDLRRAIAQRDGQIAEQGARIARLETENTELRAQLRQRTLTEAFDAEPYEPDDFFFSGN